MRVATYNILASRYGKPERYPHMNTADLHWEKRKKKMAERILSLKADVICCQEVEFEAYQALEKHLASHGYRGAYAPKCFGKPEGCATFFSRSSLEYHGCKAIWYSDGNKWEPPTGHVALIIYVRVGDDIWGIANTHIKPNFTNCPPEEHVGYRQIKELIDEHMSHNQKAKHWILCGDFNADDDSIVIQTISSLGFIDSDQEKKQPTYKDRRLDYIFYTEGLKVNIEGLSPITGPLPSEKEPSDHIPLVGEVLPSTR